MLARCSTPSKLVSDHGLEKYGSGDERGLPPGGRPGSKGSLDGKFPNASTTLSARTRAPLRSRISIFPSPVGETGLIPLPMQAPLTSRRDRFAEDGPKVAAVFFARKKAAEFDVPVIVRPCP